MKVTKVIPAGQRSAQLSPGRTLTLSRPAVEPIEITIKPFKRTRRVAQTGLSWLWANELEALTGDKADFHRANFKMDHLGPIMARDNTEFAEVFESLRALLVDKQGTPFWVRTVNGFVASSEVKVNQMAEALGNWEITEAEKGNQLPRTDDFNFAIQANSYQQYKEAN